MTKRIYKNLTAIVSMLLIFSFLFPIAAQKKPGGSATTTKKQTNKPIVEKSEESCEIWSGTIDVIVQRSETHTKVTKLGEHMSDRYYTGTQILKTGFDYKARFDVARSTSSDVYEDGSKIVTLKGGITAGATRYQDEKDNWKTQTDCFPDTPRMRTAGKDSFSNIKETGQLPKTEDDGQMVINKNQVRISLGIPEIQGTRSHKTSVKPYGWCIMEDNPPSESDDEGPTSFSAERVEVEAEIDPQNPNLIKGSAKTDEDTTVVWHLSRRVGSCDQPLRIDDLRLAHHVFPNATEWEDISDKTVDGNQVRITATVVNDSKKAKTGKVVFRETKGDEPIGEVPVEVAAESEKEVEFVWDSNGFAWSDNAKKASEREIEASVDGDAETAEILIIPKPVILVHGLWSNAAAWKEYPGYLGEMNNLWRAFAVGADPAHGLMNTGDHFMNNAPTNSIFQNAGELGKQIKFAQEEMNAWRVDVVAHSMGGLISRFYIHHMMKMTPDGKPTIAHLVMLGTPNMGSPWADIEFYEFKENGYHVEALRELQIDVVRVFNTQITNRKGVKFSIVYTDKIPFTGNSTESGDGVVPKSSAIWEIKDVSRSDSLDHTKLTGKTDFMMFVYPRLAVGPLRARQNAEMRQVQPSNETFAAAR